MNWDIIDNNFMECESISKNESTAQNDWMKLSNPPFDRDCSISHILTLNETELLVLYDNDDGQLIEIWIYNICNDNYSKLIPEESINENIQYYTASLNDNKSFLYLFGESGKIIKLNLKTKQFEISNKSYHDGSDSRSLFINGQLHIFGGWWEDDKYHFIWSENKKELIKVYYLQQIENELFRHFIEYLKTQNSVLIIPHECERIYLYSLTTNKCEILPIKISESISPPIKISYPKGVLSRNEHYMIVSGTFSTGIYVVDLNLRKSWKSNIEKDKYVEITIISDIKTEELLCFGHIRQCWKSVPYDVIKLIDAYFTIEVIHAMNTDKHLCINIDKLLTL